MKPLIRLQKYLSMSGIASRRKAEELIQQGSVTVNGETVSMLGLKVDPEKDEICVNGEVASLPERKVYYAYYKPRGIVVSREDDLHRKTIFDVLPDVPYALMPVGRLDKDSEGLIFLTNDGVWVNRIAHPSSRVEKEYEVVVSGSVPEEVLKRMVRGVRDRRGEFIYVAGAGRLSAVNKQTLLSIVLQEGRNRHIRRILEALDYKILQLKRVRIGRVGLGHLKPGKMRVLSPTEVSYFK